MDQETKSKSRHEVIVSKVPWSSWVAGAFPCRELPLKVTTESELQPKAPTLKPPRGKPPQCTHRFSRSSTQCLKDVLDFVRQVLSIKGVSMGTVHGCSQETSSDQAFPVFVFNQALLKITCQVVTRSHKAKR